MNRHVVCKASELPVGSRKILQVNGKSIGVFNVKGEYFALRNLCPHQMAELCLGRVTGYCEPGNVGEFKWTRDGEIIRCPWHGWEFDIKNGKSIFNPHKVRTKSYEVKVEPERGSMAATDGGCGENGKRLPSEAGERGGDIDAEGVETFDVELEEDMVVLYA